MIREVFREVEDSSVGAASAAPEPLRAPGLTRPDLLARVQDLEIMMETQQREQVAQRNEMEALRRVVEFQKAQLERLQTW